MQIKVLIPFVDFVHDVGMIVGNVGETVDLPDSQALSRIDGGFAEAAKKPKAEAAKPAVADTKTTVNPLDAPTA